VERTPDSRPGPEQRFSARSDLERVERALSELPAPHREAVVLRDLEGFSYREIARILGVRIGTVRSRIARGRQQLRMLLEEKP
jgi:RNA polymerase sigma-70 factor (ECF subfamily)